MSVHLKGLTEGVLGDATIIVGDPGRVSLISSTWDESEVVSENREFSLAVGSFEGTQVSICSTGIGVGSTEIAVTELIENGARAIVRCGGCGAWQDGIEPGEIIMNSGMARSEGMLSSYVPSTYPAVADPLLLSAIRCAMDSDGITAHIGVGLTSETYYLGQGRRQGFESRLRPDPGLMKYWTDRGILNCEMETAALYLLGSIYSVPVANSLVVHVSRRNEMWTDEEDYRRVHQRAATAVLRGVLAR
ncbi:purine or other phosphorylase family 1 [Coriobacterium glomerans PW2]|uniref:Uridine phosphorylase n=1 Tax=Coriobacterium glomerans (strain ATCC 49209 / DSM 20642 / JCM 10262 / PW2) TaxID=700015 RepID=F2N9N0_CORGP|nr:nucleoside phosphorylase [Coriobacterium glomerans]AEB07133.1 purine or other phosphorylase family 1 [Coriobacterium glomerans PW2]